MDKRGVIGHAGGLPWKLSADLKRFKDLTMGHHLIMGRRTFDSLGRILPGRTMLVLSRSPETIKRPAAGDGNRLHFIPSLNEAMRLASVDKEVFVIGGAEIFALALPRVEKMYVTWVEAEVAGDVHFPPIDWSAWRETRCEQLSADEKNEYPTRYCVYERAVPFTYHSRRSYDPPDVLHGTPGPKRFNSNASSAQASTKAKNEMISMTV
jgi:dihydrofolate reductase